MGRRSTKNSRAVFQHDDQHDGKLCQLPHKIQCSIPLETVRQRSFSLTGIILVELIFRLKLQVRGPCESHWSRFQNASGSHDPPY